MEVGLKAQKSSEKDRQAQLLSRVFGSRGVFGGGFVGSRGRLVRSGSRLVLGFFGVHSSSFVFDISDEAIFVISLVGDNLDTAIGKVDTVRTLEVAVVVLSFGLFEVGTRVVIGNTVLVGEGLRGQLFFFVGGGVIGSGGGFVGGGGSIRSWWGVVGPGNSHGEESGENGGLKMQPKLKKIEKKFEKN